MSKFTPGKSSHTPQDREAIKRLGGDGMSDKQWRENRNARSYEQTAVQARQDRDRASGGSSGKLFGYDGIKDLVDGGGRGASAGFAENAGRVVGFMAGGPVGAYTGGKIGAGVGGLVSRARGDDADSRPRYSSSRLADWFRGRYASKGE